MAQYVCNGAMMRCTMGMAPSTLTVLPVNRVMNNNQPQANIMDNKPMVNILPFGLCRSLANPVVASATSAAMGTLTPMPCIPNTPGPWMPGTPKMLVANQPALHKPCKLMCVWAGTISIVNPGQVNVKDSAVFSFNIKTSGNDKENPPEKAIATAFSNVQGNNLHMGYNADASVSAHTASGDITFGNQNPLLGQGEIKFHNAQLQSNGQLLVKDGEITGAEFNAIAGISAAEGSAGISTGNDKLNPLVAINGSFEAVSASAHAKGFIGSTPDKVGFAFDASAEAKLLGGSVEGIRNISIPFTNWTIQLKAKASKGLGAVGGSIGGKAYYDKNSKRAFIGASGKLSAIIGIGADIEISIGKKYE